MKKQVHFALVVCLVVLAVAIVLGIAYPDVGQALVERTQAFGQRLGDFFDHVAEDFRNAFIKDA
jgi:hypothetical protein